MLEEGMQTLGAGRMTTAVTGQCRTAEVLYFPTMLHLSGAVHGHQNGPHQ